MYKKNLLLCLCFFITSSIFIFGASEENAIKLYNRGKVAQAGDDYYQAIEMYKQSLELNPSYLGSIQGLAECYFFLDEFEESLNWVEKAKVYSKNNPEIINLEARIRLGMGEIPAAEELFQTVLEIEPNNLSALFGYAEIEVVSGQVQNAARKYENALKISPDNSKALLSLILVYDNLGETEKAEYFARRALELHSSSVSAHYITARHFFRSGNTAEAEYHAKTALNIDPRDHASMLLLCDIYLATERYDQVMDLGSSLLEQNRRDSLTWYILGIASWRIGNYDDAWYYFNEAMHLQNDDEIVRIAAEQLLLEHFPLDHEYRKTAAAFHFNAGVAFTDKNLIKASLREYRRGLMLDPYSEEGRFLYGKVFRDTGNLAKYVSILDVIIAEGTENREIKDEHEIYSSMITDSVAQRWNINQFVHVRDAYSVSLFYQINNAGTDHPESEALISGYLCDLLFAYESIKPLEVQEISGFAEAYRNARNEKSDYFITVNTNETERILTINLDVYNSETGTLIYSTSILRTGNGRISDALSEAAKRLNDHVVPRGRLIARSFNQGVIDLGSIDSVKEGDVLDIVRRGGLGLSAGKFGFDFLSQDRLGKFTVTEADYLVSEGTITRNSFFDMINQYDHVILVNPEDDRQDQEEKVMPVDLYRMLLRIP